MGAKIRAGVALTGRRTEVREFDFPAISDDAGLLKMEVSGMCGSDWRFFLNSPQKKGPLILGHESVGFVAQIGRSASERWGIREGDRVALEEYLPCGHCEYCRSSDFRLCDATDTLVGNGVRYGSTGISVAPSLWGGYSQYQYLHPNAVFHKVPPHVPAEQAALALPLGNGIEWAVLQGGAGLGKTVVIQGPGQQGLACVVGAKEAGASCIIVTGLTRDEPRLALARELGAHHAVDVERDDLLEAVAEITGGRMADLAIDCASGGPATVVTAIQLVRKRGRVILGGMKGQRIPEFDSDLMVRKFVTVMGVRGHSYQSVEMALEIIASGRYPLHKMCTHVFALDELTEALETLGGEGRPDSIHCSVDPWR
jgi:threonine dehydrogenase-like Zn-dependent dehydrogenase